MSQIESMPKIQDAFPVGRVRAEVGQPVPVEFAALWEEQLNEVVEVAKLAPENPIPDAPVDPDVPVDVDITEVIDDSVVPTATTVSVQRDNGLNAQISPVPRATTGDIDKAASTERIAPLLGSEPAAAMQSVAKVQSPTKSDAALISEWTVGHSSDVAQRGIKETAQIEEVSRASPITRSGDGPTLPTVGLESPTPPTVRQEGPAAPAVRQEGPAAPTMRQEGRAAPTVRQEGATTGEQRAPILQVGPSTPPTKSVAPIASQFFGEADARKTLMPGKTVSEPSALNQLPPRPYEGFGHQVVRSHQYSPLVPLLEPQSPVLPIAKQVNQSEVTPIMPNASTGGAQTSPNPMTAPSHVPVQPTFAPMGSPANLEASAVKLKLETSPIMPLGMPVEGDLAPLAVSTDPLRVAPTPASSQAPNLAPPASAQIVAAISRSDTGTTEIRLNPEELGRVRISMTATEAGMSVTILTERPETADLLRRNIETLAQDLNDLGYENLSFEFGGSANEFSDDRGDDPAQGGVSDLESAPASDQTPHLTATLRGGLDLKL